MSKKAIANKKMAAFKLPKQGGIVDDDGFEILGGSSQEIQIGEVIEGVYGGVTRSMPSRKKGQPPIPFYQVGARQVLGGTVLRQRIEEGKVKPGDTLRITRLEDAPAKRGQNPAKLFDVRVKRK
jgi:hypothetical protein